MNSASYAIGVEALVEAVQRLSLARDLATVQRIVRESARHLTGADGATFVLRDDERCYYAEEDAIAPLWKGQRFPMSACISGWAMLHRRSVAIADIYTDDRVPHDAYRPTFVKSLVMVPIRTLDPIGAIGNYWAQPHDPTAEEIKLLQALADTTAVAMENVCVFTELEDRVRLRTAELTEANRLLEATNRDLLAAQQQADRVFQAYARALPGTVLDGKYRLDEELGAGGFGVVFRGHHLVLDAPIAVKVFRPVPGNDSALELQRFLREGAAASRIAHPNAVRIFDSGVSGSGIAFLIMELLCGRSLADELVRGGLPSQRRAAIIAARVADVLAAAHKRGVLHRDIKPENIYLHHGENGETVKVVDFGLAGFFGDAVTPGSDRLTRNGEFVGTPAFVAPERVVGGAGDGRSDVFSLGEILYQMLAGSLPWLAKHQIRMACGLAPRVPPPPLSQSRRNVAPQLESIVLRTLAWEPSQRPTAQQLADELEQLIPWLDDGPAEQPDPQPLLEAGLFEEASTTIRP